MISVLIRERQREIETQWEGRRPMWGWRRRLDSLLATSPRLRLPELGEVERESHLELSEGAWPYTLASDLWPPSHERMNFCYVKPLSVH